MACGVSSSVSGLHRITRIETAQGRFIRREWASADIGALLGIDPQIEVAAQRMAARLGLAPEVIDFDADSRVMLMQHVEGVPLESDWWRRPARRVQMRDVLERLREIRSPSLPTLDIPWRVSTLLESLEARDPRLAASRRGAVQSCLSRWSMARDGDEVMVHGDLTPPNILVRADGSWCLLDWEYAHRGHADEDLAGLDGEDPELARWAQAPQEFAVRREARSLLDTLWRDLASSVTGAAPVASSVGPGQTTPPAAP